MVLPLKSTKEVVQVEHAQESALQQLNYVSKIMKEWIHPGHVSGQNTNNISCTIYINNEKEWDQVFDWIQKNKNVYNGLSFLPRDNGVYKQAPLTACTQEYYEYLCDYLKKFSTKDVVILDNGTDEQRASACDGPTCEF